MIARPVKKDRRSADPSSVVAYYRKPVAPAVPAALAAAVDSAAVEPAEGALNCFALLARIRNYAVKCEPAVWEALADQWPRIMKLLRAPEAPAGEWLVRTAQELSTVLEYASLWDRVPEGADLDEVKSMLAGIV